MMQTAENAINKLGSVLEEFLAGRGAEAPSVKMERPPSFKHADITTSSPLTYAKKLKENPYELAEEMASYLLAKELLFVEKVEVAKPGFLNIFFTQSFFQDLLSEILSLKSEFGKNPSLEGERWVVEHTSPNPNKAMHLGHLRNNLLGMGLVRLLSANGAEVFSDAVDNDRGIAIAKVMWGFLAHMKKTATSPSDISYWAEHGEEWLSPEDKGEKPDIFVTNCYILGEQDFRSSPEAEEIVRNLVVKWEAKDKAVWKLWSRVLSFAYAGMERTLARLGNHWDKVWHEHEHYQEGKDYVLAGLKKGVFKQLEDGAVLTDLGAYNIPDTILLKSDGTSLYITQDIALTALKKKHYKADKLLWVIGPDQSLAMKQMFAVCEQLGIGKVSDFTHVPYGYVGLKDEDGGFKKMSSREGTVLLIDDLIDKVREQISEKIKERKDGASPDKYLAEKLALAAVKFSLLKVDRGQDLTFDVERSIETTGDSGIYIIYTYVRTRSILRKKQNKQNFKGSGEAQDGQIGEEAELLKILTFFGEAVERARDNLSLHPIAQYLLELCGAFNSWYAKEIILDGSSREAYKLAITESVGLVIKNGLDILGIEVAEEI